MAKNKTARVTEDECRAALKDATEEKPMTAERVKNSIALARQTSGAKEQLPAPKYEDVARLLVNMEKIGAGIGSKVIGGQNSYFLCEVANSCQPDTESMKGVSSETSPASGVRSLESSSPKKEGESETMEGQNQGQEAQVQGSGALPEKKSRWRPSLAGVICIVIGVVGGSVGLYTALVAPRSADAAQTVTMEKFGKLQGKVDELGKRVDGHDTKIVQIGAKTDVLEKAQKEQREQYAKYESALAEFGAGLRDVNDAFGKDKDGKFQALYNSSGQTWQAATADLSQDIAAEKRQRMSSEAVATLQDPGGYAFVPDNGTQGDNPAVQPQPVPARPVNQVYLANNVNVEEGYAVYWSPQDSAWITIRWNPGAVNSPCTYQMSYYCQNSGCYKWRHCRRMWRKAWKRGW